MRTDTKTFFILKFIGKNPGVTYRDILNHVAAWALGTTIDSNIFKRYCTKIEKKWYLTASTVKAMKDAEPGLEIYGFIRNGPTLAEGRFKDDTIHPGEINEKKMEVPSLPDPTENLYKYNGFSGKSEYNPEALRAIEKLHASRERLKDVKEAWSAANKRLDAAKKEEQEAINYIKKVLEL